MLQVSARAAFVALLKGAAAAACRIGAWALPLLVVELGHGAVLCSRVGNPNDAQNRLEVAASTTFACSVDGREEGRRILRGLTATRQGWARVSTSSDVDVRLDRVTKRFGEFTAVDELSLEIEHGEFFSLLGPSGCGKTTTLRMIGGFEEVTAGTIYLGDADVTDLPPFKRDTNTVFQNYALFPHLNVYENIAFGLRRRKVPPNEIRHQVAFMLKLVELPGYESRKPSQLSGGQQQRVALARALINHPRVLLLDEPLGALDLKLRKQMQVELKRIQQEVGITFIYVTHDQEEAMTMSDRIAVMNKGRYEQLGDPESLYERPSTRFVAGFLGISNLLPGAVEGGDGRYTAVRLADDSVVRVPSGLVGSADRIAVGVRPEKIRLRESGADIPDGQNRLTGVVRDASYLGVSTQYQVEARGGIRLTVYEQNVERATRSELWSPGEEVVLSWLPDHSFAVVDPSTSAGAVSTPSASQATQVVPAAVADAPTLPREPDKETA